MIFIYLRKQAPSNVIKDAQHTALKNSSLSMVDSQSQYSLLYTFGKMVIMYTLLFPVNFVGAARFMLAGFGPWKLT